MRDKIKEAILEAVKRRSIGGYQKMWNKMGNPSTAKFDAAKAALKQDSEDYQKIKDKDQ